jgi:hypothetical protein
MLPLVRRVLGDPIAIYTWLLVTLVGLVAAVVAGRVGLATVIGWAVGGIAAVVVAVVKKRRGE